MTAATPFFPASGNMDPLPALALPDASSRTNVHRGPRRVNARADSRTALRFPDAGHRDRVIGAGVVGLAVAARLAPAHPGLDRPRAQPAARHGDLEPQQPGRPRRHLLSRRLPQGAPLRRGPRARLRPLPPPRHSAREDAASSSRRRVAEELPALDAIAATARANGVALHAPLGGAEAHALEPSDRARSARCWSPESGIVDAHGLMDHFLPEALAARRGAPAARGGRRHRARAGAATGSPSEGAGGHEIIHGRARRQRGGPRRRHDRRASPGIDVDAAGYRLHWCKGSYFSAATRLREARLAPRLPRARAREPRRPRRPRHRRPAALRARTPSTCRTAARTTASIPRKRGRCSPRRPAVSCPTSATRTSSPTSAASGRSCRARASPFRDFVIAEESGAGTARLLRSHRHRVARPDRRAGDRRARRARAHRGR